MVRSCLLCSLAEPSFIIPSAALVSYSIRQVLVWGLFCPRPLLDEVWRGGSPDPLLLGVGDVAGQKKVINQVEE